MATTPTTPNQEEESVEVMEDVSTILKNEIQSICTRLANLGEESLFLSAKVAEKETTKLGSDTGFMFMSKFNIVQQFYQFVEDVYTTKQNTDNFKLPGDADQNQKQVDATMEMSKQVVDVINNRIENKHEGNHGNSAIINTSEKISSMRVPANAPTSLTNSHLNHVAIETAGYTQQPIAAGQTSQLPDIQLNQPMNAAQQPPGGQGHVEQIQLNQPPPTSVELTSHISNIHLSQPSSSQLQQSSEVILQGNDQPSNDQMLHITSGSRAVPDSNGNPSGQVQTFHENINSESQIPLQFLSNVPTYLPVGIGNSAGVFVDQGNILQGQGFMPQYGMTSNIPTSSVNTHVVSHAEMEKIDPTGIVNQALVQSGIHENLEPGNHGNMDHSTGSQVSMDGTAAKLAIPEGLDILQSDDTSKYHFFLEALRYLNPELYPRTEFSELNHPRNEGGGIQYAESEVLQYSDAQHLTLPNPNLPHNFSDLPTPNNQQMLNSIGQPVLLTNSQEQEAAEGTKITESGVPTEKKKKKKKKKKKDPNLIGKATNDLKLPEIKPPEIPIELSSPSKKPGKGKSYKCDICNQFVDSHRDIALHKVMHGGKVPPKCSICNNRFTTKRGLKHHMQKHQKENSSSYSCDICDKVFTEKDELVLHQQEHGHVGSQNNVQLVRPQVAEYNTASYEGHMYNQTKLSQPVAHFPQSEQAVNSAISVPVGNVMISSNDNVDNIALQTALVNQRMSQDNQQSSNFIPANSEMLCQNIASSQQTVYSNTSQGVEQNQQLLYPNNGQTNEHRVIYSTIDQNQSHVNVSHSENINTPLAQVISTENDLSTGGEENVESESTVGILTKTGESLDLSKMENASDIVLTDEDGTKGLCKICGEEITSFEQTIVHFTIHKEQQSINESKKKRDRVKEMNKKQQTRNKKGRKYPCETCGQQFQHFNDLCLHRISHKGKSPEKCQVCEKGFTSKRGVRLHMELHKKDSKPYLCTICKIEISDIQEFIDHKKGHGEQQEDETSSMVESVGYAESGRSSSNSVLMAQHCPDKVNNNQIHQNINIPHTTNEKGELLQTTNQIHQNLNTLPQSTNEKAEIHNTLNDIQTIIHHTISNNAPTGNYQSGFETALGGNPQVLQQSTAGYNNPNLQLSMDPLQIAQMNLFFQQLNEQVTSNMPVSLQQDSTIETQQQTNKTVQNEHQITQNYTPQLQTSNQPSGEKKEKSSKIPKKKNGKYHCDECEKAFPLFHDLRLHKVTHRGKTPQLCTVCNKLFVSKKGLRDHMTLHKKQLQKNVCDICEKEFTDLNHLILHKLEHVEEARSKHEKEMLMKKQMEENYDNQIVGEPKVANYDSRLGVVMTTTDVKGHDDVSISSLQQSSLFTGQLQNSGKSAVAENIGCQNPLAESQQVNTGENRLDFTGNQQGVVENQIVLRGDHQMQTGSHQMQAGSHQVQTGSQHFQTEGYQLQTGSQISNIEGHQIPVVSHNTCDMSGNLQTVQLNEQPHESNLENTSLREVNQPDNSYGEQHVQKTDTVKDNIYETQQMVECSVNDRNRADTLDKKIDEAKSQSTLSKESNEVQGPVIIQHNVCSEIQQEVVTNSILKQSEGQSSKGQGELNKEKSKDTKLATELTCLIDHVSNDSTNDEHECPFCRERFSGPESLKQHLYIHIEDSDTAGDEQSDESMVKIDDFEETFNHKDEKLHMCDVCGETFSEIKDFEFHCKKHKPAKEYKCQVCNENFTDLVAFKDHKKVNGHENRRHKCDICFRLFNKEENLKKHNIKMHKKVSSGGNLHASQNNSADSNSKSVLTCSVCGKAFRNKYKLSEHVNYHKGTTPHKCQVCYKIFTRASGLKDHMNLHLKRKPYRCDVCGKRYADISNWRKHKTSHTNSAKTTPFKCNVCKEKFSSWKKIKNHTELLHPDNLKFLRISNKPKLKKTKNVKQVKK